MRYSCGAIICDNPNDAVLDMRLINFIVEHTHNKWQPDRPIEEIRRNTIQGKKAEYVLEAFLRGSKRYRYLPYDDIRNDGFIKHAPFDGLIYRVSIDHDILQNAIKQIQQDVANSEGDSGAILPTTRGELEKKGIFTLEIKSSQLKHPRDYGDIPLNKEERTSEDYASLCSYIRQRYDYFVYPHFCRNSQTITNFSKYTQYVRDSYLHIEDAAMFLSQLLRYEYENACLINTRIFIDNLAQEIIIPGYTLKKGFFERLQIQKMPSEKSKHAIYYFSNIFLGRSFSQIDDDFELLNYNVEDSIARLSSHIYSASRFAGGSIDAIVCRYKDDIIRENRRCPKCGGELVLRTGPFGQFYGCTNYYGKTNCKFTIGV